MVTRNAYDHKPKKHEMKIRREMKRQDIYHFVVLELSCEICHHSWSLRFEISLEPTLFVFPHTTKYSFSDYLSDCKIVSAH